MGLAQAFHQSDSLIWIVNLRLNRLPGSLQEMGGNEIPEFPFADTGFLLKLVMQHPVPTLYPRCELGKFLGCEVRARLGELDLVDHLMSLNALPGRRVKGPPG